MCVSFWIFRVVFPYLFIWKDNIHIQCMPMYNMHNTIYASEAFCRLPVPNSLALL